MPNNPPPKTPNAESLKAELLAELRASLPSNEELLEAARAQLLDAGWQAPPKPKRAPPKYVAPKKDHLRIRIRSMNGKHATPKVSIYDDSVQRDESRVHGYLHAGQVVDVPPEVLELPSVQYGIEKLMGEGRIEECSKAPATRPFFYANYAEAKVNDPRFRGTLDEAQADISRIEMSASKRKRITAQVAAEKD